MWVSYYGVIIFPEGGAESGFLSGNIYNTKI